MTTTHDTDGITTVDDVTISGTVAGKQAWMDVITLPGRPEENIIFYGNGPEMMRIDADGFYVRGVKIPQDADEARAVYDAFIAWMKSMEKKND